MRLSSGVREGMMRRVSGKDGKETYGGFIISVWTQINRDASTRMPLYVLIGKGHPSSSPQPKSLCKPVLIHPQRPQPTAEKALGAYLRFIAETVRERVFAGTDGGGVRARSSIPPPSKTVPNFLLQ
jgi:hypothetical protein